MREQRRKLRIRRRNLLRGFILFLFILALVGILWPHRIEAGEPLTIVTVQVEAGDSLWELAAAHDNNTMDLRKYIYLIQQYNNMDNCTIYPGQLIKLPIYSNS